MSSDPGLVIGLEPFLTVALSTWRLARPGLELRRLEATQGPDFVFDLEAIDALGEADGPAFVAIDHRYLGFKRLELMGLARARGVRLVQVVGPHAVVGEGAEIAETAYIGEGAIIGVGAKIGDGACVGARAVVGPRATLGVGAWLDAAAVIGAGATIGAQTSIGSGVIVAEGAEIGTLCVLGVPGLVRGEVRSRTYLHPAFSSPIRIFG